MLLFLLLQGAIFVGLWAYARHAQRGAYLSAVIDKHQRLDAAPSPRVLIVGGSSSAFGVRSDLIGKALNRTPVNLSLHAGLGRAFMIGEATNALRKDDLVLLSLEYHLYQQPPRASSHVWAVMMARPQSIADLRAIPMGKLFDSGFLFVHHIARTAVWSALGQIPEDAVYRRDAFNHNGDVIIHHGLAPVRPFLAEQPKMRLNRARLNTAIADIQSLQQACDGAGAKLAVFFPPIEQSAYEREREQIDMLVKHTTRALPGVVVSRLQDIPLPDDAFYDTSYHLTREASERRTQLMIKRLASSGMKR